MDEIDVTTVLTVRESPDRLPILLTHLEQQNLPSSRYEILIVDYGETDEIREIARRHAAGAPVCTRCVRQEEPDLAAARNLGLREARGRWVVFLADDVVAGPELIRRHVEMQERHGGAICVPGSVKRHPQLGADIVTRGLLPEDRPVLEETAPPHFFDCRADNLCLPRQIALDSGGFLSNCPFSHFDDVELVWRLTREGMGVFHAAAAVAYAAMPVLFAAEHRRLYERGYCLWHLERHTGAVELAQRYGLPGGLLRKAADAFVLPFYLRASLQPHIEDIRLYGHAYRRILRADIRSGYADARLGRPPRPHLESAPVGLDSADKSDTLSEKVGRD